MIEIKYCLVKPDDGEYRFEALVSRCREKNPHTLFIFAIDYLPYIIIVIFLALSPQPDTITVFAPSYIDISVR